MNSDPESTAGDALPYAFARRHGVLLADRSDTRATVLHKPGLNATVCCELRRHLGCALDLRELPADDFEARLAAHYQGAPHQSMQIAADLGDDMNLDRVASQLEGPEDLLDNDDDAPIVRLINALFTEAIKENASDIHIEPYENRLAVRFRVDGVLREVLHPSRVVAPYLVSRIKVMARLDIAEKRLPQDGRISLTVGSRPVDVRVSTLPSNYGERVVLRLLDKQTGRLDLTHLGMPAQTLERIDPDLITRPHGIFLVTGPTGSGKTTTLYALLSRLNDKSRNIVTVEDPIEYHLDGIGQTQVNTKVDLSFARGLRAILRQDPDVVMIGEIRDRETAQIAVQASLTGHLVLSSVHTNTAVGTITRLRDMGIEPFLLSSSLAGVLAQRLVRLLCPHCRRPYQADAQQRELVGDQGSGPLTLYHAQGCEHCMHTGYIGRTGIYELLTVDDTLRSLIHDGAGEQAMLQHVRRTTPSIRDDGIRRVLDGDTSLDEVVRVTQDH